jgi:hypothetical protein
MMMMKAKKGESHQGKNEAGGLNQGRRNQKDEKGIRALTTWIRAGPQIPLPVSFEVGLAWIVQSSYSDSTALCNLFALVL